MLHQFFDKTYLINLDSRPDRLELSQRVCGQIGLEFERYRAIPGAQLDHYHRHDPDYETQIRWNSNAAALVKTTLNIIEEAQAKKYKSILIMEDDIDFAPQATFELKEKMYALPSNWELFYFGATHLQPVRPINSHLAEVVNANSCHCYAINESVYGLVADTLRTIALPLDYYLRLYIQTRRRSYCLTPNIAYQFSGISDIEGGYLDTSFVRKH